MNRKRILSLIMAFCMVLSLLPADVLAVGLPVRGSDVPQLVDGYYEIYNADQLYWFAAKVNSGNTSINGKLMADIVVNENVLKADGSLNGNGSNFRVWTPIGNNVKKYAGTFDGNGKTVSGLYFNDTTRNYVGLFGYAGEGAIVENVGVIGSYLKGNDYVGGVVGLSYYSPVINCFNTGIVSGADRVGGVVGRKYCYIISNCYNTGSVSGSYMMVGGVVGENESAGIHDCYNTGNVSSGTYYAGGVVGYAFGSASGCYNIGSVSGGYYVGGVVGYEKSSSSIYRNCYYLSGCARDGAGTVQFGVGNRTKGSTTADRADEMVGQSSAQFASGEVAYLLQGVRTEYIWGQAIGTDPYPVLGGEKVFFENGSYYNPDIPIINNGHYEIYNAGQLYWFAEQVNRGSTSINGKLMADIVVNENVLNADGTLNGGGYNFLAWIPIGSNGKEYAGIFDGNNHSISGMTVFNSQVGDAAMFKSIAAEGRIQNLKILDSYFGGSDYSSSAFAVNNSVVISNCINAGTVYRTEFAAGGIVCSNSGRIENCINLGSVGTFGFMSSSSGGIANSNSGTIVNCYNAASVEGHWTVGGLVAYNYGTLINCYNTGYVEGVYAVGGLAGSNSGTIMNCYNIGGVFAHSNSDNYGDGCGGVAGFHRSGTISNCYYLIDCAKAGDGVIQNGVGKDVVDGSTADVSGRTTGMTADQFASGEVAYLLQGEQTEQIWGQTIGTDAYPVLGGKKICKNSSAYYNCVGTWAAATCTEPKTCTVCGATWGSALGHNWGDATCTNPSTCTTCGATTGNALGHQWEDATCTTAKTCTVCGETSGSALGHKWTNATCTEPMICTVCGATTGIALGHSWKAATCTSPKTCTVCGLTEGNPLGHRWAEATCTAPKTCTTCGTTTGKALGHIEVVIPGYAATYEAPGLTDGSYCSRCGDTLREQTEIDPIPEEVSFSYKAYGINGSTNAVNSGYITVEIWMNVHSDFARAWGADIGLSFNQNLTLLDIQGGIFEEALATPLNIANAYNAVKITQDMVLGDDKTFTKGQYLFATLTFKVDKDFYGQYAEILVDVDECTLIRKGEFANELVTDFGTGTNIYISKLGDANRDDKISAADTMALSSWLQNADLDDYNAVFDLNKDGYIDGDDFALLRGAIVWDNGYLDI